MYLEEQATVGGERERERERERQTDREGMRREGRVTGYLRGRRCYNKGVREKAERELQALGYTGPFHLYDPQPLIKILNKPTNQSKFSSHSALAPPSKALSKTKGRNKLNSWLSCRVRRTNTHIHPSDPFYMDDYDEYDLPFDEHLDDDDDDDQDLYACVLAENQQREVCCDNYHSSSNELLHGVEIDHPGACDGDQQSSSSDELLHGVGIDHPGACDDYHSSSSAPLAVCNEVSDVIQTVLNAQFDDFIVVNNDNFQDPYACHRYASASSLPQNIHAMNGGSSEWIQLAEDDDGDDDDWLLC